MFKLSGMWDVLLHDLETKATGANIHKVRTTFSKTKDRVEMWIEYMNGKSSIDTKQIIDWKWEAIEQLKEFGYDDINQFITS